MLLNPLYRPFKFGELETNIFISESSDFWFTKFKLRANHPKTLGYLSHSLKTTVVVSL